MTPTSAPWLRNSRLTCKSVGPQRLEHPDLARLLHHERDQRAQDAQRRHDHDEEQQVEHHVLLHHQRAQQVGVLLHPGGHLRTSAPAPAPAPLAPAGAWYGSCSITITPVHRVVQTVQVLRVPQRADDEGEVVFVIAHVENARAPRIPAAPEARARRKLSVVRAAPWRNSSSKTLGAHTCTRSPTAGSGSRRTACRPAAPGR